MTVTEAEFIRPAFFGGASQRRPGWVVRVSRVANPRRAKSPADIVVVFPAASARKTEVRTQVPVSLPCGSVVVAVPVADVAAVKLAAAVCVAAPDGLTKAAWKVVAPERSSVT